MIPNLEEFFFGKYLGRKIIYFFSWLLLLTFFGSDTFAAIDKRFASYISGVGKGISSGKIAPIPKTRPVRRPKENEE